MSSNFFSGFQWWTPIPWLLATVSIAIALVALRRSRHSAARFHRIDAFGLHSPPDFPEVWHLSVDILCTGADIFEPQLYLECYYGRARHRSSWPDVLALEFYPAAPVRDAIKNGQVVRFDLTDDHLKRALELNGGYFCLPSRLRRRRARLAFYGSGNRLIAATSSRAFREALRRFESLAGPYVRTGERAEGWSHQYVQEPIPQASKEIRPQ